MTKRVDGNEVVLLSDSGQEVSFQLYQDVYNSVTGRKEKINRPYFDSHHMRLGDLKSLHSHMAQALEQYVCEKSTCSIVVRYSDSRVETFSGFERFELQVGSRNACVENIEIIYEFLLILPKTKEPKTYRVSFGAISQYGLLDRMDITSASDFERRMLDDLTRMTASVSIEYIDVAVARNIEAQIDEWYQGVEKFEDGFWGRQSRRLSNYADNFVKFSGYLTLLVASWYLIVPAIQENNASLFLSLAMFSVGVSLVTMLGFELGNWSSKFLKGIGVKSFIELSDYDRRTRLRVANTTAKAFSMFLLANFGAIAVSLIATILAHFIGL